MAKGDKKKKRQRKQAEAQAKALAHLRHLVRGYEASQSTDWRARRGAQESANTAVELAGSRMRDAARYAEENDPLAISVLDNLVDNTIGIGLMPEPMCRGRNGKLHNRTCDQIRAWYEKVWEWPETTGTYPGSEVERIAARSWLRDGEVFAVEQLGLTSELPHSHGIVFECLEADHVPFDLIANQERGSQRAIIQGVEVNRWRRPVAYHFLKDHPGERYRRELTAHNDTRAVAAERVRHMAFRRRFGQLRGVTVLHAVLTTMSDVKEAWDSERIAMRVAAALTGFIQRSPDFELPTRVQRQIEESRIGARGFELAPGMVWDNLFPGEEVGTISHDRPNNQFDPFTAALQRMVAGGTGARFSSISRRYEGSYASQRQELVESSVAYRRLFAYAKAVWYRPNYRAIVNAGILAGEVSARGVDAATLYDFDMTPPPLPWIDQKKEIEAYVAAIQAQLIAREQAIRELGRDPRATAKLIEEERKKAADMAAELGLPEPPAVPGAGDDDETNGDDDGEGREDEAA